MYGPGIAAAAAAGKNAGGCVCAHPARHCGCRPADRHSGRTGQGAARRCRRRLVQLFRDGVRHSFCVSTGAGGALLRPGVWGQSFPRRGGGAVHGAPHAAQRVVCWHSGERPGLASALFQRKTSGVSGTRYPGDHCSLAHVPAGAVVPQPRPCGAGSFCYAAVHGAYYHLCHLYHPRPLLLLCGKLHDRPCKAAQHGRAWHRCAGHGGAVPRYGGLRPAPHV